MTEGYVDPETGEIHVPPEGGQVEAPPQSSVPVGAGLDEFAMLLADMKERQDTDPEEVAQAIVKRILEADTFEKAFGDGEVKGAREILDMPIIVHSIKINEGDFKDHGGMYMLAEVSDPFDDDTFLVSTGSSRCMATLFALHRMGAFPAKVKFMQSKKPSKSGFFAMRLEPA